MVANFVVAQLIQVMSQITSEILSKKGT